MEANDPAQAPPGYSELRVLRSAAGWYVGTMYTEPEGFEVPGSRDSGYFPTKDAAARYLSAMTRPACA